MIVDLKPEDTLRGPGVEVRVSLRLWCPDTYNEWGGGIGDAVQVVLDSGETEDWEIVEDTYSVAGIRFNPEQEKWLLETAWRSVGAWLRKHFIRN